jgi:predicted dithiol-disulfide oxidoreductase (DUF899 family)
MQYADASEKLGRYRQQIADLRGKMREVQQSVEPVEVSDYEFSTIEGQVCLSELFAGKEYLLVIHNMGAGCRYCTLWADGFNGILPHIENHAAFVVASPDDPAAQQKFSTARGWHFRMVSYRDTGFARDMGYRSDDGWLPGVSVSASAVGRSIASPILVSNPETISVQFGTSSTCCRRVPAIGSPNTNTNDLGGYDGEP